jgi:hypothetical protein
MDSKVEREDDAQENAGRNGRVEGEIVPLDNDVARKPAEPESRDPWSQRANRRDGEADDNQAARHCRSVAGDH